MLAVVARGNGHKRVLVLEESLDPQRGSDEVLVTVKAASLNNGDARNAFNSPEGYRPGWDFAGIVEEAIFGIGVFRRAARFRTGHGRGMGGACRGSDLHRGTNPSRIELRCGSSIADRGYDGCSLSRQKAEEFWAARTCYCCNRGVGVLAVQLAASTGAHVTATCSRSVGRRLLWCLGANDLVIGSAPPLKGHPTTLS